MRRLLLAFGLLATIATSAFAQSDGSVSLAFDDCGAAGVPARTFACNSNSGSEVLYVSFRPPSGLTDVFGLDVDVMVGTIDLAVLPDWWSFLPTVGCRRTALSVSGSFAGTSGACEDPWGGQAFGTTVVSSVPMLPDGLLRRERIRVQMRIPNAAATSLDPAVEYYGVRISIAHAKTVGTGACSGCSAPMCLALGPASLVHRPANPGNVALVQTDRHAVVWNGTSSCDRLVPARNRTWGMLKSLYR